MEEDKTEGTARSAARMALAGFYMLAGIGHFAFADTLARIVPAVLPAPRVIVIATGLCELAGAMLLLTRRWRVVAGWALAAYALCVWPANINHALLDWRSGSGLPMAYHLIRQGLQPLIIWWTLWASGAIRPVAGASSSRPSHEGSAR